MNKKDVIITVLALTSLSGVASHYVSFEQIKKSIFKNSTTITDTHNHDTNVDQKVSAQPLETKDLYTCPMHPSVISDRAGTCPVCGMNLVKKVTTSNNTEVKGDVGEVALSPSEQVLSNVKKDMVTKISLSKSIDALGKVTFDEKKLNVISSRVAGRIEKLYVNETGKTINKGQKLLDIYSEELYKSQQEYIQSYQSYQNLKNSEFKDISESAYLLMKASEKKMRLLGVKEFQIKELEKTGKPNANITVYSDKKGVVLKKEILEGQYVDIGMTLFQVADLSTVWVEAQIYESELNDVKEGQLVKITSQTYPNTIFKGHISFIYPTVEDETKTIKIRIELNNYDLKLKPEMIVKTQINDSESKVLAVPRSAVILTGKKAIVWVEKELNKFVPKEVKIGKNNDEYYEIVSGLSEGESIASSGGFLLDSESKINIPQHVHSDNKKTETKKDDEMDMSDLTMDN